VYAADNDGCTATDMEHPAEAADPDGQPWTVSPLLSRGFPTADSNRDSNAATHRADAAHDDTQAYGAFAQRPKRWGGDKSIGNVVTDGPKVWASILWGCASRDVR
jgi:hypothetical protein